MGDCEDWTGKLFLLSLPGFCLFALRCGGGGRGDGITAKFFH